MVNITVDGRDKRVKVNLPPSNLFKAAVAMLTASVLASPAVANTITFETASPGVFTGAVTEDGFTYSKLSGGLFVNQFGNPGKDLEGTLGGGVLKIVSATGDDFNFNALDFSAFDLSGAGSQTLKVEGFLGGSSLGADQYTLANTKVFNPKYTNWTTEAASVLLGKSISELDITLDANAAGSGSLFSENIDNVVLTRDLAAIPEPSSVTIVAVAVVGASFIRLRQRRRLRG